MAVNRQDVLKLMAQKDRLEREIDDLQLTIPPEYRKVRPSERPAFVDKDGFPVSDVDIHGIRLVLGKVARKIKYIYIYYQVYIIIMYVQGIPISPRLKKKKDYKMITKISCVKLNKV